jgi:hypothetical protein
MCRHRCYSPSLTLRDVFVSPSLIHNLVSVRRLTRDNSVSIEFDPFGFSIKDLHSRIKRRGEGSARGGAPGSRPCLAAGPADLVRGIGWAGRGEQGHRGWRAAGWPRRCGPARATSAARRSWGRQPRCRGGTAASPRAARGGGQRGVQAFGSLDPAAALRPASGVGETWARPRESSTQLQSHDGVGRHCTPKQ